MDNGGESPRGSKRPAEETSVAAMAEEAAGGGGNKAENTELDTKQAEENMEDEEADGDLAARRGDLGFCQRTEVCM